MADVCVKIIFGYRISIVDQAGQIEFDKLLVNGKITIEKVFFKITIHCMNRDTAHRYIIPIHLASFGQRRFGSGTLYRNSAIQLTIYGTFRPSDYRRRTRR